MKKLIWKAVVYIVVMNAAMLAGTYISGGAFEFNLIFNVTVPILCAFAAWEVEQKKAKHETAAVNGK
ncbi:MAG: hypothetical protein IKS25_06645 [Oscillospiraceae bacterium]|nr:hypothetical protein [Oscillospiraceae bacterium]